MSRLRRFMSALFAAALLLTASGASATDGTITGPVVVDRPYSFMVGDYRIYLLGVDSVEIGQSCTIDRRDWDCWAAAQRQLETILVEGDVLCEPVVGPDADLFVIATCTVNGADVGELFVASGFAVTIPAETDRYEAIQAAAREAGIGLWQAQFAPPSVWRALPMRPPSGRPRFVPS